MTDRYPTTMTGCTGTDMSLGRFYTQHTVRLSELITHKEKRSKPPQSKTKCGM